MFEQLMQAIQQQGQESIVANPEVPNEHNEAVMQEASGTIMNGMTDMMQQQGPSAIKNLFEGVQSGDPNNAGVQQLSNNFAGNIMQKFGIDANAAKALAASMIPIVLGKIMNRAKDPNDKGFDIGSILGSLTGGNPSATNPGAQPSGAQSGGGMMDTISSLGTKFGFDKNGDGKTDLSDLMKMFS